jgi:hypothetical protein
MLRKNDMKKVRKERLARNEEASKSKPEQHPENVKTSFDFGGLPDRDLKKNLGCG